MNKLLILLAAVSVAVLVYYFVDVQASDRVSKHLKFIQQNFNSNNYGAIWDRLSDQLKKDVNQTVFAQQCLNGTKNSEGNIISYAYISVSLTDPLCHKALFTFNTTQNIAYFDLCLTVDNKFKNFWWDFQNVGNQSFFQWTVTNPNASMGVTLNTKTVIDYFLFNYGKYPVDDTFFAVIAAAYSILVDQGRLNPNQQYSVQENLNLYYLPTYDTAHYRWLEFSKLQGQIIRGKVKLQNIVQGMISYRSLCNAEFLQGLIGFENINSVMLTLGISQPYQYFVVSSLLVFKNFYNLNQTAYIQSITNFNQSFISQKSKELHNILLNDPNSDLRDDDIFLLDSQIEQIIEGKLMTGSAFDYLGFMGKINSDTFFNRHTRQTLRGILGQNLMTTNFGEIHFNRGGFIDSDFSYLNTTNNSIASVAYAQLKNKNKIEYAYFANNIDYKLLKDVKKAADAFFTALMIDPVYFQNIMQYF